MVRSLTCDVTNEIFPIEEMRLVWYDSQNPLRCWDFHVISVGSLDSMPDERQGGSRSDIQLNLFPSSDKFMNHIGEFFFPELPENRPTILDDQNFNNCLLRIVLPGFDLNFSDTKIDELDR
jgi:hypothetical protein